MLARAEKHCFCVTGLGLPKLAVATRISRAPSVYLKFAADKDFVDLPTRFPAKFDDDFDDADLPGYIWAYYANVSVY
jgi:hypothetical protein